MIRHPPAHPTAAVAREIVYAPDLDGAADPGEIVWTPVVFEDDPHQGKDRPVLVVGRNPADGDRSHLLGLMMSSKAYHREDPDWLEIGTGALGCAASRELRPARSCTHGARERHPSRGCGPRTPALRARRGRTAESLQVAVISIRRRAYRLGGYSTSRVNGDVVETLTPAA